MESGVSKLQILDAMKGLMPSDYNWSRWISSGAKPFRQRWAGETRSKYMPHQGQRECARRIRKAQKTGDAQ